MKKLFLVIALKWQGDEVVGAKMGQVDIYPPSNGAAWLSQPAEVPVADVVKRLEEPDTVVVTRNRSGSPGPYIRVGTGVGGRPSIEAVPLPGMVENLDGLLTF